MSQATSRLVVAAALMLAASSVLAKEIVRRWNTGESRVEIHSCGELLCERIAELDEDGNEKLDKNNPDPALRAHPLIGE